MIYFCKAGSKNVDLLWMLQKHSYSFIQSEISSWTYPVNETHSGSFNTSDYYGYGFHVENGDGTINQG